MMLYPSNPSNPTKRYNFLESTRICRIYPPLVGLLG